MFLLLVYEKNQHTEAAETETITICTSLKQRLHRIKILSSLSSKNLNFFCVYREKEMNINEVQINNA